MVFFIFITFIFSIFCLLGSFLARDLGYSNWFDRANLVGWTGFAVTISLTIGAVTIRILKDLAAVIRENHKKNKMPPASKADPKIGPSRRNFMEYSLDFGLIVFSGSITARSLSEALVPRVKEVDIEIKNLPPDLDGYRIVQISDFHISTGALIHRELVQKVVNQVNSLSPDIIAFTGDFADGVFEEIKKDAQPLAELTSKHGKFFVTGNHEYWYGVDNTIRGMEGLGFTVLMNEHRLVKKGSASLLISGVADYTAHERSDHDSSPARALGNPAGANVKILLAHQPISVYEAARAGCDLQLSGHTHGGQCFFGAWLRTVVQPFQSGLYQYKKTQLYVSNGTGYWGPPFRFGAPSEITLLRLRRKV